MAGRLISHKRQVLAALHRGLTDLGSQAAGGTLQGSRRTILAHEAKPGVALGSGENERDVAASGYVVGPTGSGYSEAVSNMISTLGTRTGQRNQIVPPVEIKRHPHIVRFKIAYAAGHAILMHDGYDDYRGPYRRGVKFLEQALKEMQPQYFQGVARLLMSLQGISMESIAQARVEAWERSESAAIDRMVRQERGQQWQAFLGTIPASEFQRQRFGTTGFTESRIAKDKLRGNTYFVQQKVRWRRETAGERDERIETMYREWLSLRNTGGGFGQW